MGSRSPAASEPGPDCKRRRRDDGAPKIALPTTSVTAEDVFDTTQPDWWKPQPRATLDPSEYQDRPTAPLARALSCALCHGLLREAMTAPECGHSYCYDCIEARVEIGGNHNVCPAPGCGVVLGPTPFDHHRLMYDSQLDTLVQKVFPRPELDAALSARRAQREEATRLARAAVNSAAHGRGGSHLHRLSSPGRTGRGRDTGGRAAAAADTDMEADPDGGDEDSEGKRRRQLPGRQRSAKRH